MVDLIYDFMATGVDMVLNGVVLALIISLIAIISVLGNKVAEQQANADLVNDYRKYAMYNNRTISLSDYQAALTTLIGKTRINIVYLNAGRERQFGYQDVDVDNYWYFFNKTNNDLVIQSSLLAPSVDGSPVKAWDHGEVGGVNFVIKDKS